MTIDHGAVKLRFFTVTHKEFGQHWAGGLQPPFRYYLVTQVYRSVDEEYLCTQLLGIDLRAVKSLKRPGCEHSTRDELCQRDRERIEACFEAYARGRVAAITGALMSSGEPPTGTLQ